MTPEVQGDLIPEYNSCFATIWIHTHYLTGCPLQIDVLEWSGRVDVLDQLRDATKFCSLDLSKLKYENWINVGLMLS